MRKKLLRLSFAAKFLHFTGKNFRGSTKLGVLREKTFAVHESDDFQREKTFAVDRNERYFSILLDTTGAFNGITLFTNRNKLD